MFATYLIFFLAICYAQSASVSQDVANSIPKNYTFNVKNTQFHLMLEHLNFYDALSSCESLGMKLVAIETKQDNDDITQIFVDLVDLKQGRFWTSGVRLETQDWAWLTAKKYITYTFWGIGKPDNVGGNENCITIDNDSTGFGTWDDEQCDLLNYYICEE